MAVPAEPDRSTAKLGAKLSARGGGQPAAYAEEGIFGPGTWLNQATVQNICHRLGLQPRRCAWSGPIPCVTHRCRGRTNTNYGESMQDGHHTK